MGLGKTVQLLALLAARRRHGRPDPAGLPDVAGRQLAARGRPVHPAAAGARPPRRRAGPRQGVRRRRSPAATWSITTYALAARDAADLRQDHLATRGRRRGAGDQERRHQAGHGDPLDPGRRRGSRSPARRWRTGSPTCGRSWSSPTPGLLGPAATFKKRYAEPIERHGDDDAAERLRRFTGPFILRRVKTDKSIIADLPEKLEMDVLCNLTAEQAALYQAVVDDMLERIGRREGIERRGLVLATMTKLKQVCNHPAHFLRDGSRLAGRSGKLERLDEILDEVLAVGREGAAVHPVRRVRRAAARPPRRPVRPRGAVPARRRAPSRPATRWSPASRPTTPRSPPLFVLSLKAGGTGLTLTAANHVVHVDRWWNPAVEDQATDRAFRIGQRRAVQVRKFVCAGTLEEKIAAMIRDKRGLAAKIVGTGEQWLTELSTGQLRRAVPARGGGGGASELSVGWYPPSRPRAVEDGLKARTRPRRDRRVVVVAAVPRRAGVVRHGRPAGPGPDLRAQGPGHLARRARPARCAATVQGSRARPYGVTIGLRGVQPSWSGPRPRSRCPSRRCPAPSCWPARCRPSSRSSSPRPGAPLFPRTRRRARPALQLPGLARCPASTSRRRSTCWPRRSTTTRS